MIHTDMPQNFVVFLLFCKLTRSAIHGVPILVLQYSWTVLVHKIKGKSHNFEPYLCGSLCSTFNIFPTIFIWNHFMANALNCPKITQSKAMWPCKFNYQPMVYLLEWLRKVSEKAFLITNGNRCNHTTKSAKMKVAWEKGKKN